jgi:hypothetical protein
MGCSQDKTVLLAQIRMANKVQLLGVPLTSAGGISDNRVENKVFPMALQLLAVPLSMEDMDHISMALLRLPGELKSVSNRSAKDDSQDKPVLLAYMPLVLMALQLLAVPLSMEDMDHISMALLRLPGELKSVSNRSAKDDSQDKPVLLAYMPLVLMAL